MEFRSNYEKRLIQKSELPFDLISEMILTRLPIKSVVRFKSVSKLWYSTLSSPHFASAHLKIFIHSKTQSLVFQSQSLVFQSDNKFEILSYEDGDQSDQVDNNCEIDWVNAKVDFDVGDEDIVLVGTCNGLVCLGSTSGCLFIIWNPITREFFKYQDSEYACLDSLVTWGFGYVSSVDDYKIVRLCRGFESGFTSVHVYSTRVDKLRRIDNDDSRNFFGLRETDYLIDHGELVNETLYWMDHVPTNPSMEGLPREILSFDLATELFNTCPHLEVSTPLIKNSKGSLFDEILCNINGCLSKYGKFIGTGKDILTILKRPGEIEQVTVPSILAGCNPVNLIGFTGSNKIFALYTCNHQPFQCLAVIDLTSPSLEHIILLTLELWETHQIAKYSPSLISPYARVRGASDN